MTSKHTLKPGLVAVTATWLLAGCASTGSPAPALTAVQGETRDDEVSDEMGPPPYEYFRIRGEAVPGWIPAHLRRPLAGVQPYGLEWSRLGPKPITSEFWSGNDDASGRVVSIAPHPTDPDTCYIGSASGGLWKTTNGGASWTPLTDELSNLNHGCVALDPSDPNIVYAGTGEYTTGANGDGLFKSTDAGATWEKIGTTGEVGTRCSGLIVDPTDPRRIHVTGQQGYKRTDDGGATWTTFFGTRASSLAMKSDDPQTLLMGVHNGNVYRSIDGGDTWTQLGGGLPQDGDRVLVAFATSAPMTAYAAIIQSSSLLGLYRTDDAGDTWTDLPNTPDFPWPQGWYDAFIGVDPTSENIIYGGGVFPTYAEAGVIKSTDGGNSWDDITISGVSGQLHPDQHAIAFGPTGTIWIGNDGGVWKSEDGGASWINCNSTLEVTQNYEIAVSPIDSTFIMGGTQDNGTVERQNLTDDWPQIVSGDGGYLEYDFNDENIKYTTYVRLRVFRHFFGSIDTISPSWGELANFIAPMVMDPNDSHTLLGGTTRVWRITNAPTGGGGDWVPLSAPLDGSTVNAIAVATGASDTIYAGTSGGNVFVTTDSVLWENRSVGFPGAQVVEIAVDPDQPAHAFAAFFSTGGIRLMRTVDYGMNWTDMTGTLPAGVSVRALAVDWDTRAPHLFVGTGVGVYHSTDGGATWTKDGDDLPNVNIGDLEIDPANRVLYAGTYGRGAWRTDLPGLCPADVPGVSPGVISVEDLLAVLGAWGPCPAPCLPACAADVNEDCVVDVLDLLAVLGAWGTCE